MPKFPRAQEAPIREVSPEDVYGAVRRGERLHLVDVRDHEELAEGMIPGATHVPLENLRHRVKSIVPDTHMSVIVYCASGVRSVSAAATLEDLGYKEVASMLGGFNRWWDLQYPFVVGASV